MKERLKKQIYCKKKKMKRKRKEKKKKKGRKGINKLFKHNN